MKKQRIDCTPEEFKMLQLGLCEYHSLLVATKGIDSKEVKAINVLRIRLEDKRVKGEVW